MFTGIVERRGRLSGIRERAGGRELIVSPLEGDGLPPWKPAILGESIAVNGVCLTAARLARGGREVSFEAVPETLSRTTIGRLRPGDLVNLERSLAMGDPLGGHFVTGHVDGVGTIQSRTAEGDQVLFRISAPPEVVRQLIPKGSVAVDGISLTVIDVDAPGGWFSFAAIPHTLSVTTLGLRAMRDPVNLESDAFGKWVLHGVRQVLGDSARLPPRSP